MEHEKIQPIIVCGTGRSGTSLVAGILSKLGVFMGYTFIPASWTNKHGTFEDAEFISLNRELVWNNCTVKQWLAELVPLIERRFALRKRWGWKNPATVEFLKYYTKIFPNARYVRVERNRDSVIASCMRCYDWSHDEAEEIYGNRVELMDKYLKNPFVIKFEELIKDSLLEVTKLANFVGLQVTDDVINMVDPSEVHHSKETYVS